MIRSITCLMVMKRANMRRYSLMMSNMILTRVIRSITQNSRTTRTKVGRRSRCRPRPTWTVSFEWTDLIHSERWEMPSAEPNSGSLPPTFSQWMEHDDGRAYLWRADSTCDSIVLWHRTRRTHAVARYEAPLRMVRIWTFYYLLFALCNDITFRITITVLHCCAKVKY